MVAHPGGYLQSHRMGSVAHIDKNYVFYINAGNNHSLTITPKCVVSPSVYPVCSCQSVPALGVAPTHALTQQYPPVVLNVSYVILVELFEDRLSATRRWWLIQLIDQPFCRPQMGPMLAPWTLLSGTSPESVKTDFSNAYFRQMPLWLSTQRYHTKSILHGKRL